MAPPPEPNSEVPARKLAGVVVTAVDPNSDAAQKGLARGVVIHSANGRAITSPEELEAQIRAVQAAGREAIMLRLSARGAEERSVPVRLRDGEPDISVKDPAAPPVAGRECGNGVVIDHGGGWETQSCHLARGSIRVKVGQDVAAGQPIARVGLSGNTEYPHLHLTVRQGARTVDPFLPDGGAACAAQAEGAGLWTPATAAALAYRTGGAVLNAGFADGPVDNARVEAGTVPRTSPTAPALVAYVRAINLQGGDRPVLTLTGPGGLVLTRSDGAPLDRSKAQWLVYTGLRTPLGGWPRGRYQADYSVIRDGRTVLHRSFDVTL